MAVITIARQFGAGGKTLGSFVADKLGYTLIDEQIVEMIAQEANVSPDWVDSVAREAGSEGFVSRMMARLGPFRKGYLEVAMEQNPGYIDGDLYIALLHRVIPRIAAQGNVVIIGRGGQYILGHQPDIYHFLMIADMEHRLAFISDRYHLDRKQAQIVVEKQDKRRSTLYRSFARTDYEQANLYHMVFNMNRVKMDKAVQMVCSLVGGQAPS